MPRTTLIVNPTSNGGRTGRKWEGLRAAIESAHGPFETKRTERTGDATRLTREALAAGAELVVAVGGDGTINEVVNGFFDERDGSASAARLGVIPTGTGGDLVRTLGIPRDPAAAAALLRSPASPIDVGRLDYTDDGGRPAVRRFINIASFGIGGLVDRYVNGSSKWFGGTVTFALASLRAGARYKNADVRLSFDGEPPTDARIYNVAVANGRYFGGGMMVAPNAETDDGLFDVVTMGDFTMGDLLLRGLDIYSGKHLTNPRVSVRRARKLEATPADRAEVLLDVDGEAPGRLPATFEVLRSALRIHRAAPVV